MKKMKIYSQQHTHSHRDSYLDCDADGFFLRLSSVRIDQPRHGWEVLNQVSGLEFRLLHLSVEHIHIQIFTSASLLPFFFEGVVRFKSVEMQTNNTNHYCDLHDTCKFLLNIFQTSLLVAFLGPWKTQGPLFYCRHNSSKVVDEE